MLRHLANNLNYSVTVNTAAVHCVGAAQSPNEAHAG